MALPHPCLLISDVWPFRDTGAAEPHLVDDESLVVAHVGERDPEVVRVALVVLRLHLIELEETRARQLPVPQLHVLCGERETRSENKNTGWWGHALPLCVLCGR